MELAQIGITSIFLIFAGATVAFHVVRKQASGMLDLAIITLNSAAFYGISYWLIYEPYRPWMGGFTVSLAAFYALMAVACRMRRRGPAQPDAVLSRTGGTVRSAGRPDTVGRPLDKRGLGSRRADPTLDVLPAGVCVSFAGRDMRCSWCRRSGCWSWTRRALSPATSLLSSTNTCSATRAVALPALAGWLLHLRQDDLAAKERVAIPLFALRSACFAAIVVPIQLDGIWIAVAWMVEAVFFIWLSFFIKIREIRWFGHAMAGVFAGWLLVVDSPAAFREELTPFINRYMVSYASAVLALASASWLLWRRRTELGSKEAPNHIAFAVASCAIAAVAVPLQLDGVWVTVAWAIEATLLLWLSFPLRIREVRWSGYLLFVTLSAWLLAWDTPDAFREDLTPFLNLYTLSYGMVVASAMVSSWLLWHKRESLERNEQVAYPVFAVGAAAAAAIAIPMQLEWP